VEGESNVRSTEKLALRVWGFRWGQRSHDALLMLVTNPQRPRKKTGSGAKNEINAQAKNGVRREKRN
jgi:hypothetical protein